MNYSTPRTTTSSPRMHRRALVAATAIVALALAAPSVAKTLKIATGAPDKTPWMNLLRQAGADVETATKGRVRAQVLSRRHPGGRPRCAAQDAHRPASRRHGAHRRFRWNLLGHPAIQPADGVPRSRRSGRGAQGHGPRADRGTCGGGIHRLRHRRGGHGLRDEHEASECHRRRPAVEGLVAPKATCLPRARSRPSASRPSR